MIIICNILISMINVIIINISFIFIIIIIITDDYDLQYSH